MKETADNYLGKPSTKAVVTGLLFLINYLEKSLHILMIHKDKLQKMLVKLQD